MENFKDYWDKTHSKYANGKIVYDNWVDKHLCKIKPNAKILDLGCGTGNDTLYLTQRGFDVLSCDYSEVAINSINNNIPGAKTKLVDISKNYPSTLKVLTL